MCLTGCAENSSILDNGQNRQLEFSAKTCSWNNSNKSSAQKVPSRATPISGSTFDTSKNFNVIADVNKGSDWSTEINNETASYSSTNNIWQTSDTHYWPGSGSTVNFYAYYPTGISSSITHTAGSAPVLSYTVPDNTADQIDILTSSKADVAGDSYTQIPVDFKHILSAVQFSVGTSGLPNGTITKVTLNNIQYKGTYSLNGTWTPNTTDKKSFSQTVSASTSVGTVINSGTTTFMMMPQTLDSDASITVTYSNGGSLTKAITGIWEAGKTYTYNLSKTIPVANFDYTGDVQSYTVPLTGTYKLEVWGAQGGDDGSRGGYGGYSFGTVKLSQNNILYITIGGKGSTGAGSGGGYNGGGNAGGIGTSGGGGGATCVTSNNKGILSAFNSFKSEVFIVAGGAGGAGCGGNGEYSPTIGGSGGGMAGGSGYNCSGGTQTTGYEFGQGQNRNANGDGGGGGGGWYGGYSATADGAGAGGSGYIGGVTNGQTIAGDSSMPAPSGGTETGHSGNGYARITFVSAN